MLTLFHRIMGVIEVECGLCQNQCKFPKVDLSTHTTDHRCIVLSGEMTEPSFVAFVI